MKRNREEEEEPFVNVDKDNKTPLHNALWSLERTKVLIRNGADVNAVDAEKRTPLHCAACKGYVDIAKVLIRNGANVNAVDGDLNTPLFYAAEYLDVVLILQLLCFGAVIDKNALEHDKTGLLGPVNNRMNLLRAGERPEKSLMSNEERQFMWNLAFSFTIQHPAAA